MMRSLYSAVSGLKTHQTRMDVIGNNISNVNTAAFKASAVVFSSIMYQTLSGASGANAQAGTGGVNPKQIGLGVTYGSTAASITSPGAAETTGLPFDLRITDKNTSSFFIVNNGSENVFTKQGSFYVDGAGNLCMKSTGYTVMGWGVDPETQDIRKDTVSALRVMSPENRQSEPEATTRARCTGVVDGKSTQITSATGSVMNLTVYDNLGYPYTVRFAIKAQDAQGGKFSVNLTDIIDSNGKSVLTSDIQLSDIFGPGTGSSAQGSNIVITDNYTFSTGKSKDDISRAIQKSAADAVEGTQDDPSYTYYIDAADLNAKLGLTGSKMLPEGYRLRFVSTHINFEEVKTDLLDTANTKVYIEDAAGNVVAQGTAQQINSSPGNDADQYPSEGSVQSGVKWTFVDGTMDAAGNFTADPDGGQTYNLTLETTLDDYTSLGTTVTSTTGITGYRFNVDDIRDLLGLDETTYPDGSVLYYWPTFTNGMEITVSDPASGDIKFDSMVSVGSGATVGAVPFPIKYSGPEELLQEFSYTIITGSNLARATDETGQIFTEEPPSDAEVRYNMFSGSYKIVTPTKDGFSLQFNTVDGTLTSVGGGNNMSQTLNLSKLAAAGLDGLKDVTIDFSALLNYNNNGSTTAAMSGGDIDLIGKGKKLGTMNGLAVDQSGKIYASYDNGDTVLLGQIAVAQFANASGLEATGDDCYRTTLNSGEFDGIGVEIDADGSSITSGELEMSNVDLAGEFTSMITTQRGFQANSRVITTSDSMLEELINLKR